MAFQQITKKGPDSNKNLVTRNVRTRGAYRTNLQSQNACLVTLVLKGERTRDQTTAQIYGILSNH